MKTADRVGAALVGASLLACSAIQVNAQTERQLDAHQHGHGSLNIAVEGQTLQMELNVPGADIVGFEHAAKTKSDKAKIDTAKKTLSKPLALFTLPAEAGCKISSSKIAVSGETDHEGEKHEHGHHDKHEEKDHQETHSEFHAEYKLACKNVEAVTRINFPYFKTFPNSEELDVRLITDKGQKAFEVNRKNALIDIRGMM